MADIRKLVAELDQQKQKLKESEDRLFLQYSISQTLASSVTIEEAMQKVIEAVCNAIGWKYGAFWIHDEEAQALKPVAYWQNAGIQDREFENATKNISFSKGMGLPGRVWQKNDFDWVADVSLDSYFSIKDITAKFNLHSAFAFPVTINDTVLGVIEFFSDRIHEPDVKLIDMFKAFSNQIAQFIQKVEASSILQESEKRYKQLVEEASDIIYRTNYNGFFIYVNPIAARIIKTTEKELIGKHFTDLIRPDYRGKAIEFYKKQFFNKTPLTYFEFPIVNSEKGEVWIGQNVKIIFENSRIAGFQAVARDITERKHFEEELLQAKEIAEQSKKAKEIFLANMSHEIRTPMNAILGMTDILKDTELSLEQKECVHAIKLSSDNLLSIINDILDISKIEAGKITFEKRPLKLEEVVEGIIQTLHFTVKKSIALNYFISENVPPIIIGDVVRLRQILLNLCSNSIKFTERGSVKINVELKEQKEEVYTLLFTVSDTGIGIPEEKLASIFESFVQASSDTTRKYGGTGLGLAITKQLIELQGGSISVTSTINKGSQFLFTLPFKKGEEHQLASGKKEALFNFTGLEGIKVLIVEDNSMNQILAKKIFNKWNLCYDIAANGKIAIEKLSQTDYDIILMDMHMPEMDGYEATKYIRNQMSIPKSQTPIIAVTANAVVGEEEKCLALGMNDYISKPLNKKILYQKILKWTKDNVVSITQPAPEYEPPASTEKYTDLSYLEQIAEGNKEFMADMIHSFIKDAPQELSDLGNAFAAQKWPELKSTAHTMKSSVDFMGIHNIRETVRTIEHYAEKKVNLEKLPILIELVNFAYAKAMEELKIEIKQLKK